jgi:hypothetical protein
MCENYDAGGANGKVDILYVSSVKPTTVVVGILGLYERFPINPGQVLQFRIPLGWEMNSSGIVENKGVRVWSDDADLTVYLMNFNPYTSEGLMIMPTTAWGTKYVVAAYAGLFEDNFDYPSEYSVVADQNGTVVANVCPTDIRANHAPTTVLHPALTPFTESLSRGECVQYETIEAQNCDNYDMTGTILNSNNPIGVEGASMCPNIPCDYPYCDFVCEQSQPIRCWSNAYMTVPYAQRHSNNGDTFLAIPSYSGQTIYTDDATTGVNHVFCTGLPKFSPYWFDAVTYPTKFHSDSAFELLQYENSSTWADGSTGDGAMTTVPGVQEYTSQIVFQTPVVAGLPYTFTNFVNIILPAGVAPHTTLTINGRPTTINSVPGGGKVTFADKNWEGYVISGLEPGMHFISCDTSNGTRPKIGAYVYGYGSYDSYSWAAQEGVSTIMSSDSIAPTVQFSQSCYCGDVVVVDSNGPGSGLNAVIIDSSSNFTFTPDPNYLAGAAITRTFYDICVIDSSQSAFLQVSAYDMAGNHTTITSSYTPDILKLSTPLLDFGVDTSSTPLLDSITIHNPGSATFKFSSLKIGGSSGAFKLESNQADSLRAGDSVKVYVGYIPHGKQTVLDTLIVEGTCLKDIVVLFANSKGVPQFTVSNDHFGCDTLGDTLSNLNVALTNPSPISLTVDSVWVGDTAHFHFLGKSMLPLLLPANTSSLTSLPFSFTATGSDTTFQTLGYFFDKQDRILKTDTLYGCGIVPLGVATGLPSHEGSLREWLSGLDTSTILLLPAHPNPTSSNTTEVTFTIGLRKSGTATLKLFDLLGREQSVVLDAHNQAQGISDIHFETKRIPNGTYVYRLEALGEVRTGQLVIQR